MDAAGIVQIAGALLILVAFTGGVLGRLRASSYPAIALNLSGSGTLAVLAALQPSWGFLLLEGSWAVVSLWALVQRLSGREPAAGH